MTCSSTPTPTTPTRRPSATFPARASRDAYQRGEAHLDGIEQMRQLISHGQRRCREGVRRTSGGCCARTPQVRMSKTQQRLVYLCNDVVLCDAARAASARAHPREDRTSRARRAPPVDRVRAARVRGRRQGRSQDTWLAEARPSRKSGSMRSTTRLRTAARAAMPGLARRAWRAVLLVERKTRGAQAISTGNCLTSTTCATARRACG